MNPVERTQLRVREAMRSNDEQEEACQFWLHNFRPRCSERRRIYDIGCSIGWLVGAFERNCRPVLRNEMCSKLIHDADKKRNIMPLLSDGIVGGGAIVDSYTCSSLCKFGFGVWRGRPLTRQFIGEIWPPESGPRCPVYAADVVVV